MRQSDDGGVGPAEPVGWRCGARLRFSRGADGRTVHQGRTSAPLRVQRGLSGADGRCQLPLLHTGGGLVGGDVLEISADLAAGSRALITSVAAQKVYGSIGRSRREPRGLWARQELTFRLEADADLEWLPQELVLYADGLYSQHTEVHLAPGAAWLGAELVRLGRTAAGEGLGRGRWRSALTLLRRDEGCGGSAEAGGGAPDRTANGAANGTGRYELVDRLQLDAAGLEGPHGLAGEPVYGSLVWAAPTRLAGQELAALLEDCRADRAGLKGTMACGALEQGLVARYRGPSTGEARAWFTRIWARLRDLRGLAAPELPRVWPFQEAPLLPAAAAERSP